MEEKKDEGVENESVEQLAFADRILLNKIDLVTEDELARLEARIRQVNSGAPIKRTLKSQVDLDFVLNIGAFDLSKVLASDPAFLQDQEHQVRGNLDEISLKLARPKH